MRDYLEALFIALIISWLITPWYRRAAEKLGLVDEPNARRLNRVPVPTGGGIVIMAAFWAAVWLSGARHQAVPGLLAGSLIIGITGLADDRLDLRARTKLMGQILAAAAVVANGTVVQFVTNPFGGMIYLGWLGIPLTILWIVAVTNMFNFIDGLDGLAAGVAVIASVSLFGVAHELGYSFVALLLLALAGSTLGFLRYNFNPASVFMGDTGAMFLGFMLSSLAVEGALKGAATVAVAVPVVILGLPTLDTVFSVVRRVRNGVPFYQADQGHLHHRLLDLGLSQRQAVLLLYGTALVFGSLGVLLVQAPPALGLGLLFILMGLLISMANRWGWIDHGKESRGQGERFL
ncbi:MAG: undecaprenyl/decaprenyl-phosphate alpha-N-acetylglucosaminyl 1-phosphate transferase [Firmicutes bacterium]|jgi:UDP-GlcNAc:undecaprenyl-phosphate GlcNAc-1-phosphate transferase|nr:undecaprenyl/decaprenyl-phosphate alpha-N-acetylglucosaminyl 1-phosphate transferase [Bacillota bacterium]